MNIYFISYIDYDDLPYDTVKLYSIKYNSFRLKHNNIIHLMLIIFLMMLLNLKDRSEIFSYLSRPNLIKRPIFMKLRLKN